MSFSVNAQCPLKEAVDFSAKDYDGNDINLFEILDRGQYVLINFFCTTSEQCQKIVPNVVEAYKAMGSNKHDVFFMEISSVDNSYAIEQWVASYGVEYPTIYPTSGGTHGGDAIYNMYQIPFYPVLILIAPDRKIVIQDLWPVTSSQSIIDALVAFDIEKWKEYLPIVKGYEFSDEVLRLSAELSAITAWARELHFYSKKLRSKWWYKLTKKIRVFCEKIIKCSKK